MNNATDATIYGNEATENRLNPILNPISFLQNPYQLEQLNKDKTPYPVWGMDISYGGFFGKAFEKTVGAFVKPDLIQLIMKALILTLELTLSNKRTWEVKVLEII